jgi:uncharacterized protein involved in outer membrane biogenesis
MRKFLRWLIVALACLLGAVVLLILFREPILIAIVERRIESQSGLKASIGGLEVGVGRAAVTVKDFRILNPPEFGGGALLHMPELHLEVDPQQAAEGRVVLKQLRLRLAEVNLVRGRDGTLNLEALQKAALARTSTAPGRAQDRRFEFGGIARMTLSLGQIAYTDLRQPANNRRLRLDLQDEVAENLKTVEDLNNWLWALAFRILVWEWMGGFEAPERGGWQWLKDGLLP